VLEALGARIELDPARARQVLDETGFTFLFAPAYHSGMKHAAVVRRQLSVRTVMNLLGPCVNPARPPVQLLGVADAKMLRRIAQVLQALGVERALVVHGAGLDEVALHAETRAIRLVNDELEEIVLAPEDAGFERMPLKALEGGDPADNADRLRVLLEGGGSKAERQAVALNAGALLWTAGLAPGFAAGAGQAMALLSSGAAGRTLAAFVEATNG
jgi:anthranilate phosphoribosyltransferase